MKANKENLKDYLMDCCFDRAEDYNRPQPNNWQEARNMIQEICEAEKLRGLHPLTSYGRRKHFCEWIFGLCFCSPIMEDLTPYTNKAITSDNEMEAEQVVANAIYELIYID